MSKLSEQFEKETGFTAYSNGFISKIYSEKYIDWLEAKAGQHETIVNCPEPFTAEFLTFLLVNALRGLNEAQRHNLALSLAVRDPKFSIEEYEKQLGN